MAGFSVIASSKVRHPPFESSLMLPNRLPALDHQQLIAEVETLEEAKDIAAQQLPPFSVGPSDGWFVSRGLHIEGPEGIENIESDGKVRMDIRDAPLAIERQRTGWYLRPNPIHRYARGVVTFAVALLLIALLFQTIEPMLVAVGVLPSTILGGVRFGLLDYPFLVVYIGPLMLLPYLLRLIANVRDLRRQSDFLSGQPPQPEVLFLGPVVADSELECRITFTEPEDDWKALKVWWQVGALPPVREVVMQHLSRAEDAQPPPGLSTPLPQYWEEGLSDGGGFGEETPMMQFDAPGGLFLRPLRLMEWGGRATLEVAGGEVTLSPPVPNWPGTHYDNLACIHWELIIRIDRSRHGPLFWVHPLRVAHGENSARVDHPHINDGRIEDAIRFEDESHPIAA